MGGGHGTPGMPRFPYPKWVWAPSGWWPHPRQWRINTAVVVFGLIMANIPVYLYGKSREDEKAEARRREILGHHDGSGSHSAAH